MKSIHKSVLGAALALASTAAYAEGVDVEIFGTIDVAVAHISGSGKSTTGLSTGGANISRVGLRGNTEELGDYGLKAGFWLEAGIDVDTGNGKSQNGNALQFNRRATVSLSGDFGEIRLGRDDSATFLSTLIFDPFLTNGVGGTMSFAMLGAPGVVNTGGAPIQISNAVSYFLPPNIGGLYGQIQAAAGESANNKREGDYYGLRLGWKGGEFNSAISAGRLLGATEKQDLDIANVALAYNFGWIRPILLATMEERDTAKITAVQLGMTVPLRKSGVLKASVGHYEAKNILNPGRNADWNKFSLGYGYNFSKQLQVYGTLSFLENDGTGTRDIGIQGLNFPMSQNDMPPGGHAYGIETGIRLFF